MRRRVYYFGYGANSQRDMVRAITGTDPEEIGRAVAYNYGMGVQTLSDIPTNPRTILRHGWGDGFKSYVMTRRFLHRTYGTLWLISQQARKRIDHWELSDLGWYDRAFVTVRLVGTTRFIHCETQVIPSNQHINHWVRYKNYHPWLQPPEDFARAANKFFNH